MTVHHIELVGAAGDCSIITICGAIVSRIDASNRNARGHPAVSLARGPESPLANSVTSWPMDTSSSVRN